MKHTIAIALTCTAVISNMPAAFAQKPEVVLNIPATFTQETINSSSIIELAKTVGRLEQQNVQQEAKIKRLKDTLKELQSNVVKAQAEVEELKGYFAPTGSGWPHAINCGVSRDMLFILHASPGNGDLAWYVQVYPNEYRYVRFNADGSYHDRAGADAVSVGCNNKSIDQLRREHKAYKAVLDISSPSN